MIVLVQGVFAQNVTTTISGTIINTASSSPVVNQAVYIYADTSNSTFNYYNTVYTNQNGYYVDTLSIPTFLPINFIISTSNCNGAMVTNVVSSDSLPMVSNFTIQCGVQTGCPTSYSAYPDSSNYLLYYFYNTTGLPASSTCLWNFGDGTTSALLSPVHTFPNVGSFTVCLSIYDSLGNINCTYCDSLFADTMNIPSCQASFQYSESGNAVTFYGYTNNGTATYLWDFGDGTNSYVQDTTHQYAAAGTYYVCLTINTSNGCTNTYCQYVNVGTIFNSYLCGQVMAGANYADHGTAALIVYDSLSNSYNYAYTTTVDSMGYYCFQSINPGFYLLLASLSPNSLYYNDFVPTYYGDVDNWANATPILISSTSTLTGYNINMVSVSNSVNGNGSIGGTIIQGGNKVLGQGDPLSGVEVLLLDNNNNPLASTHSNTSGTFVFNNLSWGTYKIYTEIAGLPCTPGIVTISATNPDVSNILITVKTNEIVSSINDILSEFVSSVGSIYPNPTADNASINISLLKATEITVSIYNVVGQKIDNYNVATGYGMFKLPVNVENLTEGIYSIQLTTSDGLKVIRKFVKTK